ncbi:MAG: hypothetical protein P8015_20305, partial [Acidihalobacter sp.]
LWRNSLESLQPPMAQVQSAWGAFLSPLSLGMQRKGLGRVTQIGSILETLIRARNERWRQQWERVSLYYQNSRSQQVRRLHSRKIETTNTDARPRTPRQSQEPAVQSKKPRTLAGLSSRTHRPDEG